MRSKEELERKSKRVINGCLLPIVIILFIAWIWVTFVEDQEDFLKFNKKYQYIEMETVYIINFRSSSSPWREYSMVSRNPNQAIGYERVVRAVGDYIGRAIKVRQLPNNRYIRDRFVLSKKTRDQIVMYAIAVILLNISARIRRKDENDL